MAASWPLRPEGRRGVELRGNAAATQSWSGARGPDPRPEGERCATLPPPQMQTPRTKRQRRSPGRAGQQLGRPGTRQVGCGGPQCCHGCRRRRQWPLPRVAQSLVQAL
eukprot:15459553-Alexandrium_andersonii.AAC.1